MKKSKNRVYVLILSIICVLCFSFVFNIGLRIDEMTLIPSFPSEWLGIHENGGFSFMWLGFLFDIVFFYLIFWLLIKTLISLKKINR